MLLCRNPCLLPTIWRVILLFVFALCIDVYLYLGSQTKGYIYSEPNPSLQHQWITVQWNVKDWRRLGNELFDFAAIVGIGKHQRLNVMISKHMKISTIFNLKNVRIVENQRVALGSYVKYNERSSYDCKFDAHVYNRIPPFFPQNVELYGYFQSWRYFINAEKELAEMLTFKDSVLLPASEFINTSLKKLQLASSTLIGIHIRRGDIIKKRALITYGYTVPPVSYYEQAAQYFKDHITDKELVFIICSDDLTWAKNNLSHLHKNLIFSKGHTAATDLAILSLCDHVIVSTGSYGWWAAWLANGTTIYYKDWPRNGSGLARNLNKNDYFPPKWLPLS